MNSTDPDLGAAIGAWFADATHDCPELPRLVARLDGPGSDAAFEAHLETCGRCRRIVETPDPSPLLPGVVHRPRRWRMAAAAGVLAAAAVFLVFALRPPVTPGVTAKGEFQLHVGVMRGEEMFRLHPDDRLVAGDVFGIFYDAAASGHVAVYFVDDARAVTRLLPTSSGAAHPIEAGVGQSLPAGGKLAGGEGCEFIVGLYAARSFETGNARRIVDGMVAGAGACHLGPAKGGAMQTVVRVVKR